MTEGGMRLKGHGLRHEGRVWGPDARLHNGVGHARCECGGRSPELPTTAARQRIMTRAPEARFWEKVRVADVADPDACWLWTGAQNGNGHGSFWLDGSKGGAHCHAYRVFVGPIPEGLQIDHVCHSRDRSCAGGKTCRHRRCVNPDHLEAVTPKENVRRGRGHGSETHCPKGHPYDKANTSHDKKGRVCLACKRLWMAENGHRVKRRVGRCGGCSRPEVQLVARGLCSRCYERWRWAERRAA